MDLENSYTNAQLIAHAADDKQADDIVLFDVHEQMPFADVFVIVSADNERKVKSIADEIEDRMSQVGHPVKRSEGRDQYRWVLLDFGDVIAHIFHEEDRQYYALDKLWSDCPAIAFNKEEP